MRSWKHINFCSRSAVKTGSGGSMRRLGTVLLPLFLLLTPPLYGQNAESAAAEDVLPAYDELYKKGRTLIEADSTEAAAQVFRTILKYYPGDADAMLALGRINAWHREFTEAEMLFQTVLLKYPDYGDAYIALADMYFWQGRYDEALAELEAGRDAIAEKSAYFTRRGRILVLQRRFPEARKVLTEAGKEGVPAGELQPLWNSISQDQDPGLWAVSAGYEQTDFDLLTKQSWRRIYTSLKRRAGLWTGVFELQQVERFGKTDASVSADNYFSFNSGGYLNFRLQAAPQEVLLPLADVNLEYYQPFRGFLEPSAGYRIMAFTGAPVHLLTVGSGAYLGNEFLRLRLTGIYRASESPDHVLLTAWRHYFGTADHWLELMMTVSELQSSASLRDKPRGHSLKYNVYFGPNCGLQLGGGINTLNSDSVDRGFSLGVTCRW